MNARKVANCLLVSFSKRSTCSRKAGEQFLRKGSPQARFLDLGEVAKEHNLGLKHMISGPKMSVASCRSGMIVSGVLWFGLNLLGVKNVALYDEVRSSALVSCGQAAWLIGQSTKRTYSRDVTYPRAEHQASSIKIHESAIDKD